jgi:hypothetical protein
MTEPTPTPTERVEAAIETQEIHALAKESRALATELEQAQEREKELRAIMDGLVARAGTYTHDYFREKYFKWKETNHE